MYFVVKYLRSDWTISMEIFPEKKWTVYTSHHVRLWCIVHSYHPFFQVFLHPPTNCEFFLSFNFSTALKKPKIQFDDNVANGDAFGVAQGIFPVKWK